MSEELTDRQIVTSRVIDAPREAVFRAWTDPGKLARWWGPEGFTNTFQEFDLKPGGNWRFVMKAPDGAEYPNESVFLEVAEPERFVFRHLEPVHEFVSTSVFEDLDGRTRLTWTMVFQTADEVARVGPYIVQANEQNLDRLESVLGL